MHRPAVTMAAPVTVWSAVVGHAQTLALEVGRLGINVNTVMAGLFDTQLVDTMIQRQPGLTKEQLGLQVPMGRIGAPAELATMVATLVSPNSRFVTGLVTAVDGGSLIGTGFGSPSAPEGGVRAPGSGRARRAGGRSAGVSVSDAGLRR